MFVNICETMMQMRLFLEKAHKLSQEWGCIPVVLAGDLNSMPQVIDVTINWIVSNQMLFVGVYGFLVNL